jgi:tRNA-dihydrouridine synthase C
VSAKLRLGWDRVDAIHETAARAAEGGAAWLTIHARTRTQGYAPPVDWPLVGRVRERLGIPVVANGDIHTLESFRRCREETGCRHFMLGRGALASPTLARRVAVELGLAPGGHDDPPEPDWPARMRTLLAWTPGQGGHPPVAAVHRMKQWLRLAAVHGSFTGFDAVKRARTPDELLAILESQASPADLIHRPRPAC